MEPSRVGQPPSFSPRSVTRHPARARPSPPADAAWPRSRSSATAPRRPAAARWARAPGTATPTRRFRPPRRRASAAHAARRRGANERRAARLPRGVTQRAVVPRARGMASADATRPRGGARRGRRRSSRRSPPPSSPSKASPRCRPARTWSTSRSSATAAATGARARLSSQLCLALTPSTRAAQREGQHRRDRGHHQASAVGRWLRARQPHEHRRRSESHLQVRSHAVSGRRSRCRSRAQMAALHRPACRVALRRARRAQVGGNCAHLRRPADGGRRGAG